MVFWKHDFEWSLISKGSCVICSTFRICPIFHFTLLPPECLQFTQSIVFCTKNQHCPFLGEHTPLCSMYYCQLLLFLLERFVSSLTMFLFPELKTICSTSHIIERKKMGHYSLIKLTQLLILDCRTKV